MKLMNMKIFKNIAVFLLLGIVLFSCGSTKEFPNEQLSGSKWILKSMMDANGKQINPETGLYINFNTQINQIYGYTDCNTFSSVYTYKKEKFKISNLTSTDKPCSENDTISLFMKLLEKPSEISLVNNELVFLQKGKRALVFSRTKNIGRDELKGIWRLETMEGQSASTYFSENIPTINFNFITEKISGNAGCNNFNSSFSLGNNTLNIGPFITTRKTCNDIESETKFINLLPGNVEVDFVGDLLILKKEDKTIMTFNR